MIITKQPTSFAVVWTAVWLSACGSTAAASTPSSHVQAVWKGIAAKKNEVTLWEGIHERKLQEKKKGIRKLAQRDEEMCDAAFLGCLPDDACVECFVALDTEGIDWANVAPHTPCTDIVRFLNDDNHCMSLKGNAVSQEVFCKTFDACIIWDDEMPPPEDHEDYVDCSKLTACDWDGIHTSFLGDGVCNDNMHGCYNTEICGWDGGDCCPDTCKNDENAYVECGHDGYVCRNPQSANCDSRYQRECENGDEEDLPVVDVMCASDETKYRLIMYDSFGDGWDTSKLTITDQATNKQVFTGGLLDGSQGTVNICLSKEPRCYSAVAGGGVWGVESSWEIKPLNEGGFPVAAGGIPMNCNFPLNGDSYNCPNTCSGRPDIDPTTDPDYKAYKDLYNCMEDKCLIQMNHCQGDENCAKCFEDEAPDYCFNLDAFNAVIDCAMCSCTEKAGSDFCVNRPSSNDNGQQRPTDGGGGPRPCTPAETIQGSNSVIAFSQCTNFDQVGMMVSNFDQDNFGQLDNFEACSHAFYRERNNGGHTALGCMGILKSAITNPITKNRDAPKEAIMALANLLYHDGEAFCDCARDTSEECPLCPSFFQFKTLLYESLDACRALDEIDCAAWEEFHGPCQDSLRIRFGTINFGAKEQCDYVADGCGGAGPFPAFRRMDCGTELPKPAWDMYLDYANKCLQGGGGGPTPVVPPTQAPISPTAPMASPTLAPVVSPTDGGLPTAPTPKPYVSPTSGGSPGSNSNNNDDSSSGKKKRKSHFFRNFLIVAALCGGGYYIYKKRFDTFNFMRYRRVRNFNYDSGLAESEMYSNLNNSTTFEPPSLPPPPTAMGPGPTFTSV